MYKADYDIVAMVSPKSWTPGLPVSVSGSATVHVDYSHCDGTLVNLKACLQAKQPPDPHQSLSETLLMTLDKHTCMGR